MVFGVALAVAAGTVSASEPVKPVMPDLDYCSRRDADPEKCVIQDGPPHKGPYVRQKQSSQPQGQAQKQSSSQR